MKYRRLRYRIRIEDESHLRTISDSTIPAWGLLLIVVGTVIAGIIAGGALVMLTPLKSLLPGYLKEDQRDATEDYLLRLDSIAGVYETNSRYIENFLRISDTDRSVSDSLVAVRDSITPGLNDTLIGPSARERRFVTQMQERERFNVSVLAPLAADGMMFSNVTDNGVFTQESQTSSESHILIAAGGTVQALADGTVVSALYVPASSTHEVVIQHQGGFVSKYSGLGNPLVDVGDGVFAGQVIASPPPPDGKGRRELILSMWHNGVQLVPYNYIGKTFSGPPNRQTDSENNFLAPRGK